MDKSRYLSILVNFDFVVSPLHSCLKVAFHCVARDEGFQATTAPKRLSAIISKEVRTENVSASFDIFSPSVFLLSFSVFLC